MSLKKSNLLILLLAISLNIFSQYDFRKGFVVIGTDTITGLIDYTNPHTSSNYCFFKGDSTDNIVKYAPGEITAYGLKDYKLFVSRTVTIGKSSETIFLEYLVDGKIDLYYCSISNEDLYFIEKNNILYPLLNDIVKIKANGKILEKESQKYLGVLSWLMSDAQEIKSEIYSTELTHNSLIELSKDYHHMVCKDEECIVYYKKQKKLNDAEWQFDCGIVTDYVVSSVNLDLSINNTSQLMSETFYNSNTGNYYLEEKWIDSYIVKETNAQLNSYISGISPGIFLSINRNTRSSLQLQLKYQFLKNSEIEFHKIQIPVLFTYDLVRYKKVIPFMILGISNDFYTGVKTSKQLYAKYDYLTDVVIDYQNSQIIPKYKQSTVYYKENNIINKTYFPVLVTGIGLSYMLPNHKKINSDIIGSYNNIEASTQNTRINSKLKFATIAFSIRYEL